MNGSLVNIVVEGMGAFRSIAISFLGDAGVMEDHSDHETFYSLKTFIKMFQRVEKEIGDATMAKLGSLVPKNAIFPPEIQAMEQALRMIDVAYHMNHRNSRGQIMFVPGRTPPMLDGIGSYKCELTPNKKEAKLVCDTPYPCQFDLGIITEMSNRFKPKGSLYTRVTHATDQPCRKRGDASCTYIVRW